MIIKWGSDDCLTRLFIFLNGKYELHGRLQASHEVSQRGPVQHLIPLPADACNRAMTSGSIKMKKETACLSVTDAVEEMKELALGQVKCPIHVENFLYSHCRKKSGERFYACTVKKCPVFCSDDKLRDYCKVVQKRLLPMYNNFTPSCQCDRPAALQMSTSKRNPGRPFFSCKSSSGKRCNFFQWGDDKLTDRNFDMEEKRRMQKIATEGVVHPLTSRANPRHFRW